VTQFLRLPEVLARLGFSRPTIYRRIAAGTFPTPVPLGNARVVGWVAEEIEDYQQELIRKARVFSSGGPLGPGRESSKGAKRKVDHSLRASLLDDCAD
jgi:prophage regulatory protein